VAALVSACANGHVSAVQLLLELGVPATSVSADGTTALMQACLAGHREVASILIEHGAEVEAVLEAARGQNSLSGVQRVLSRVKLPARPAVQETRDLDELVLQIEGTPAASSPPRRLGGNAALPPQRKRGKAAGGARSKPRRQGSRPAAVIRRCSPVPSASSTSSSSSSSESSSSASTAEKSSSSSRQGEGQMQPVLAPEACTAAASASHLPKRLREDVRRRLHCLPGQQHIQQLPLQLQVRLHFKGSFLLTGLQERSTRWKCLG